MTPLWFWEETAQPAIGWTYPLVYCNAYIRYCLKLPRRAR